MHKVEEKHLITASLLRRFEAEASFEDGDGRYFGLIHRGDGAFLTHGMGPHPSPEQMVFAQDVLKLLNKELHHDGAWVIVFTNPQPLALAISNLTEYARFAILWMDRDGDVQFTLDWVDGEGDMFDFADVLLAGLETWGNHAEQAWQTWHMIIREAVDPSESQTIKAAQGQLSSVLH